MTALAFVTPESFQAAADTLAAACSEGRAVWITGAGTKPWTAGPSDDDPGSRLGTTGLDRIRAYDPGDMTATLEAGVTLAAAQERFASEEQMLALDPPLGADRSATIGGIVATADCGPLAHRYGGPRDLVVGATVALSDGTIARSGGTVIKNVAGYDIAKLFCGACGTLGLILSVNVRLHPRRPTATAIAVTSDPRRLADAARAVAAMPAELEALDVAWEDGAGSLLAQCAGPQARPRAARVAEAMREHGLADSRVPDDDQDAELWTRQRDGQRSTQRAVMRVAALPSALADVIAAGERSQARLVGRAALGHSYLTVDPERVGALREALPARATAVLRDCPADARAEIEDPWGVHPPEPALALMRALKRRFDPSATCNPGSFVGGI
jgi:glycolate oxidase FAD binding subunit